MAQSCWPWIGYGTHRGPNIISPSNMIISIAAGLLAGFLGYAYLAMRPPPPKICGSPGGPPVTAPRIKLDDGRHLAYKETGVPKKEAKHKIIVSHGLNDSKEFNLPVSQELIEEYKIYILSFDRAGYGESDPNPNRSVKSDAMDIQELADKLEVGPKFYVLGISMGAYTVYGCLKYFPHRLVGAALVVPIVNHWWRCIPIELRNEGFYRQLVQDQWVIWIAHYAPWLFYWWMTQKWFPSFSIFQGRLDSFSLSDLKVVKQWAEAAKENERKARQQGIHECLHRDILVGFGNWGFEPTDISNPFPNNEGQVHIWQGEDDNLVLSKSNHFLSRKLPWIKYHSIPDVGHLLIYIPKHCEAIFRALVSSS